MENDKNTQQSSQSTGQTPMGEPTPVSSFDPVAGMKMPQAPMQQEVTQTPQAMQASVEPQIQTFGMNQNQPSMASPQTQKKSNKKLLVFILILIFLILLVFVFIFLPSLNKPAPVPASPPAAVNPTAMPSEMGALVTPTPVTSQNAQVNAVNQVDVGSVDQDFQGITNDLNQL